MKIKRLALVLFTVLLITACGSADSKSGQIAGDMCDCFKEMQESFDKNSVDLFEKVLNSDEPQKTMQEGIAKLDPEAIKTVTGNLAAMGDKQSSVFKCLETVDKKYGKETTIDKKALMQKIVTEMKQNKTCIIGGAVMNLGLKSGKSF